VIAFLFSHVLGDALAAQDKDAELKDLYPIAQEFKTNEQP
jgi:hypothetical protein